jgi:microcystin-dependent protein
MKAATGTIIAFAGQLNGVPLPPVGQTGWLFCDGRTLDRAAYPELFVTLVPLPSAAPQFALPDLRGVFLRGVDEGAGIDPEGGRPAGAYQPDHLVAHQHNWDHFFQGRTGNIFGMPAGDIIFHQSSTYGEVQNNGGAATNVDGGGPETRPKNLAMFYCIASGVRVY